MGHDMGISDFDGRTPLHLAAAEGHLECVKFLLQSCDVALEPTDRWGFTPLTEAERFNRKHVVEFLQYWMQCNNDSGDTLTAKGGADLLQKLKGTNSTELDRVD